MDLSNLDNRRIASAGSFLVDMVDPDICFVELVVLNFFGVY
jgi:hypothetical protein